MHLEDLYHFYGTELGMRVARKHISWYTRGLANSAHFRHAMNRLQSVEAQRQAVTAFFEGQAIHNPTLCYEENTAPEDLAA